MSTDIETAANALLAEVNAHLDYEDDEDMQAASDALTDSMHETKAVDPELAWALVRQVDALLDYEDDKDMQKAVDAFREILPARAPQP